MADLQRLGPGERDIDQAITALKKGAYLLKYGRRGKPKFCPFRLSSDESALIWYYGKEEKKLELRHVTRIIPGQRTAIFQRYPRPEKEYQSFSLLHNDRSLDLICKDKDEAEVWFVALKALIARGSSRKIRNDARSESTLPDSPTAQRISPSIFFFDPGEAPRTDTVLQSRLGKAFADIVSYTATNKNHSLADTATSSLSSLSPQAVENATGRTSTTSDAYRVSLSSAVSSSSQGSCNEDFDSLSDCFIWGEGTADGVWGGGELRICRSSSTKNDSHLPKALESSMVLDVRSIVGGSRHAVLITKQGEIYSWGEESGGRLGHGVEADVAHPKLINTLTGINIEMVACGEYHTCAVSHSGDLYTWGDGTHSSGLLGHGSAASHWIPKRVCGPLDGWQVSYVSCGPWHTSIITSGGQLFTFGDGTFGALGHGDCYGACTPREVEALRGLRTLRVACGVWHTAAVVEVVSGSPVTGPSYSPSSGKLFTWGDGDKGQLGHGDNGSRLVPECVASLEDINFTRVACGSDLTVALTATGHVYTMGSTAHGQLGSPAADGRTPICIRIAESSVQEVACGSHHVAVLTAKSEVYTWGKGTNGQLGHGDYEDRRTPTLVDSLKDKQVKSIACGLNCTAAICLHKSVCGADNSVCSSCHNPFNFRRKRHNCYNCGLVYCNACSSRKSVKASLAPSMNKPYRVCDDCYTKLQKVVDFASSSLTPKTRNENLIKSRDFAEKESLGIRSRLSSADSLSKYEGRSSKSSVKAETKDNFPLSPQNGNAQRESNSSEKSPISPSGVSNISSISVPTPGVVLRSTSPLPRRGSPLRPRTAMPSVPVYIADAVLDEPTQKRDSLREEIKYLKAQVEDLACKSQCLEAELENKSSQLKKATALAEDEAEKGKAAREVIKSLTEQLKELANKVPEGHTANNSSEPNAELHLNGQNLQPNESGMASETSPRNDCSDSSAAPALSSGTKGQTHKVERVIQDEPGVYITVCSSPVAGNELKRVRFSRKRFSEQEAEKWWSENVTKLYQRHNIRTP